MLTKPRLDLLMKATKLSSWRVFCRLVLIDWKRPGQPIRLGEFDSGAGPDRSKRKARSAGGARGFGPDQC